MRGACWRALLLSGWIGGLPERLSAGFEPQGQVQSMIVRRILLPIPPKFPSLRKGLSEAALEFVEFSVAAPQGSFYGLGRFGEGESSVLKSGVRRRAFRIAHNGRTGL